MVRGLKAGRLQPYGLGLYETFGLTPPILEPALMGVQPSPVLLALPVTMQIFYRT